MADGGLIALLLGWLADKVGGTILSEKFKQRFLKPGPSKTDALLEDVRATLMFFQQAQAREKDLLERIALLEREVVRLRTENAGLIAENERLQRGFG